ncbi:MAG TPA: OmpA family protein [Sphingobacteriaceae bacterium]
MALPCLSQSFRSDPADLSGAMKVNIDRQYSFRHSPQGYGKVKEFKEDPNRPPIFFKEERNTKWFIIEAPFSGELTFELIPDNIKDDYDWMLFKYTPSLKEEILKKTARPVRSNNSRNDPSIQSGTGMNFTSDVLFTEPGRHPGYSRFIDVNKGEKLVLIVDNIYKNGNGFKIRFNIKPAFKGPFVAVEGFVRDKQTNQPLRAEILFEDDSTTFALTKVVTDQNGYYSALVPVNRPINAIATEPKRLFATEDFRLTELVNKRVDFFLDTLSKGKKLILFNVHFQPNKAELVARARPELERLLAFLKREQTWSVRIIGHTNNNVFADTRYLQQLSFNRAIAVKRFLIDNGISEKRLSCTGLGGKTPFVQTKDHEEGLKNLRVEIVLQEQK